ncbi:hypothetical protein BU16DRAFT_283990 [Lophium mytilinum]|uniref:Uncharacterized protein n=1 Tax=Lophium mytilinum TaxID=390894 RepID=A0A6A6R7G8_9PEZI|nr:hypothetical protein BU16DRAFT_283990 [Lophium mytilinum]
MTSRQNVSPCLLKDTPQFHGACRLHTPGTVSAAEAFLQASATYLTDGLRLVASFFNIALTLETQLAGNMSLQSFFRQRANLVNAFLTSLSLSSESTDYNPYSGAQQVRAVCEVVELSPPKASTILGNRLAELLHNAVSNEAHSRDFVGYTIAFAEKAALSACNSASGLRLPSDTTQ